MRRSMVEIPNSYQRSTSCVRLWLDRSSTTWRHSVVTRWGRFWFKFLITKQKQKATASTAEWIILKKNNLVLVKIQISSLAKSGCCVTKVACWHAFPTLLQQSTRRQGALAFSLFGVLLAHGDLRNNKLSQLAVNLWNLSHKHGYCETRTSVSSCFRALKPNLYTLNLLYLWMQPHWLLFSVSAAGSDSGVYQTSDSAAGHGSSVRYGPEAHAAVPHLNFNLNDTWHCSV